MVYRGRKATIAAAAIIAHTKPSKHYTKSVIREQKKTRLLFVGQQQEQQPQQTLNKPNALDVVCITLGRQDFTEQLGTAFDAGVYSQLENAKNRKSKVSWLNSHHF